MSTPSIASRRRSAFTLIEVAIALALFVFGALAIVRIFPPALGVIRNNEYRTAATQNSQSALSRLGSKSSSVPDVTLDVAGGSWNDAPIAMVGTATKNSSLPKSPIDSDFSTSALNYFKGVVGEHRKVLPNGASGYVLLNAPYSGQVGVYAEDTIEGVQIDGRGNLDFSYATDTKGNVFNNGGTHPPSAYTTGVTYYVSYRWRNSSATTSGVIDEPLFLPDTGVAAWTGDQGKVLHGLIDSSIHILPGVIAVRYRQLKTTLTPSTDEAMRGYIILPAIAGISIGQTLSLDYTIRDARWMVDEQGADPSTGIIHLPVTHLDDQPLVTGEPALVGLLTIVGSSTGPQQVSPATGMTEQNYKSGTIAYPAGSAERVRTIYRAVDGWANQLSVAARSYVPCYQDSDFAVAAVPGTRPLALLPREQWREYSWGLGDSNIYFHAGDAGKTVSISFLNGDTPPKVVNSVCTIDDNLVRNPPSVNNNFYGPGNNNNADPKQRWVAQLQITDAAGGMPTVSSILSVQGLSVQARTAWLNNDRYNQVIVPGYRALTN